jgi:hypothetical protein
MTPLGNRRPEADVIPLVSFPFRRPDGCGLRANSAQWLTHSSKNTPRDRCHESGLTCADVGPARSVSN